jgi:hypothetical protein
VFAQQVKLGMVNLVFAQQAKHGTVICVFRSVNQMNFGMDQNAVHDAPMIRFGLELDVLQNAATANIGMVSFA